MPFKRGALDASIKMSLCFAETGQENLGSFMDESTTNIGNIALGLFAGSYGFGGW